MRCCVWFQRGDFLMEYAGFWIRVGAYIIDSIVVSIGAGLIGGIVGGVIGAGVATTGGDIGAMESSLNLTGGFIGLVIGIAYYAGLESSSWQATLGKKAVGIIVTDTNGNRISFLNAIGRYFAKILSAIILLIGYIMVAFTEKKQGLHDMLASTLVVKGQPGDHGAAGVFD
ncbi:RDD family protein [Erythrobacter sp. JGD-13]|uniref:RDD family protein n=3 Tax=Aurantiacibacter sediminis TaxID=2793064 RepID=A0ABS0N648_9SPHN|nr:RDD family protein [Aurantiacibacter sediminis]